MASATPGKIFEFGGINRPLIAGDADSGALLAGNDVRLESERFNPLRTPASISAARLAAFMTTSTVLNPLHTRVAEQARSGVSSIRISSSSQWMMICATEAGDTYGWLRRIDGFRSYMRGRSMAARLERLATASSRQLATEF